MKNDQFLGSDGRKYVWIREGERHHPESTVKVIQGGGGSLMVWGSLTSKGVGPLIRLNGNIKAVNYLAMLRDYFLPWADTHLDADFVFMQDNASIHKAKAVMQFLEQSQVPVLEWPPQSPDLNPIENLWAIVKKRISEKNPATVDELWDVMKIVWDQVSVELCQKLYRSMPSRCTAVIHQKGYPTKY